MVNPPNNQPNNQTVPPAPQPNPAPSAPPAAPVPAPAPAPAVPWPVTNDPLRDMLGAQLAARGVGPDAPAYTVLRSTGDPAMLEALLTVRGMTPAEARATAAAAANVVKSEAETAAKSAASFDAWLNAEGRGGRQALDSAKAAAIADATPDEAAWLEQSLQRGGWAAKVVANALLTRGQKQAAPVQATQPAAPLTGLRANNAAQGTPSTGVTPVSPTAYVQALRRLGGAANESNPEFRALNAGFRLWQQGAR